MYGREARLPIDLQFGTSFSDTLFHLICIRQLQSSLSYAYQIIRNLLGTVQQQEKALYDSSVHGKPFNKGDTVWLYSPVIPQGGHQKLNHPWTGPYKVESKLSNLNYKILPLLTDPPKPLIVHFNCLKLCTPGTWFSPITSFPNKPTSPLTSTYHTGDLAELCNFSDGDFSDNEQEDHIDINTRCSSVSSLNSSSTRSVRSLYHFIIQHVFFFKGGSNVMY